MYILKNTLNFRIFSAPEILDSQVCFA